MTLLSVLSAILIGAGFFFGAYVGCRVGLALMKERKWTPLILACIILVGMGVIAVMTNGEVSDYVRVVVATVLGFAGGLVYAIRENIYR